MKKTMVMALTVSSVLLYSTVAMAQRVMDESCATEGGSNSHLTGVFRTDVPLGSVPGDLTFTGFIDDTGLDYLLSRDTSNYPYYHDVDTLVFSQGTLDMTADGQTTSGSFDPVTCRFNFTDIGVWNVYDGHYGFKKIRSPHPGDYTLAGYVEFPGAPYNCDPTAAPVGGTLTFEADICLIHDETVQ